MQQDTHKTNTQLLVELSALRQRNTELEETNVFYETILESILNGVWVADKNDVLFYANKGVELISGLSRKQRMNGNLFEKLQEQTLKYFSPLYLKAKETLDPVYYDSVPVITPVGRQSHQSGWFIPRIQNGTYTGMICTVEDVTSRKTAEEALQRSHEVLEQRVEERADELLIANEQLQVSIEQLKQAEEKLRRSNAILQTLNEGTANLICVKDRQGRIIMANPAMLRFIGRSESEIIGKDDLDFLTDPEQAAQIRENNRHIMETRCPKTVEETIDWPNRRWTCLFTKAPYLDAHGDVIGVIGIGTDITERKQHEEALKEREERFKAVAASSSDAIFISDQNGAIIFWNNAAAKMFGYEESGIVGKSYTRLLPERLRDRDRKAWQRFLKTGRLLNNKKPLETIALRKDGSEFPVEITFSGWKVQGQYCFSFIMRDITERKEHEEVLKNREERFRTITESSLAAIFTADSNGKILYWNKSAETIFGYTAKEIAGKSIELLKPEGKRLVDRKSRENFIKMGHSLSIGKTVEGRARKKDGTEFLTETSTSSWKMGGKIMFCGIVRDITERKRMEQELQKAHDELEKKVKQRTAKLAKTNKELQASKDYLKNFAGILLSVREEERKNISTTLHDDLGSMVVSVNSRISIAREEVKNNNKSAALRSLEQGEAALRKAVQDLRRLAVDLRPPSLEIMGLPAALRDYIETIKKQSKIRITFRNDLGNKKTSDATAIAIYRLTQEAFTNITKHSKAKNVRVRLNADKRNIHFYISDDGVGFDLGKVYTGKGRLKIGITGMRERIETLGGVLVIKSILKKGTLIKAVLPKE